MTLYISPYRRLNSLREAMDRLMEESYNEPAQNEREMTLAVDVQAEDEGFVIRALVPGLEAENLSIEVLNNTVAIRGEFKDEGQENAKYLTCELPHGRFSRIVTLPVDVDSTKIEAALKNGVLVLRVPKAEAHRPKSIKVNVG